MKGREHWPPCHSHGNSLEQRAETAAFPDLTLFRTGNPQDYFQCSFFTSCLSLFFLFHTSFPFRYHSGPVQSFALLCRVIANTGGSMCRTSLLFTLVAFTLSQEPQRRRKQLNSHLCAAAIVAVQVKVIAASSSVQQVCLSGGSTSYPLRTEALVPLPSLTPLQDRKSVV